MHHDLNVIVAHLVTKVEKSDGQTSEDYSEMEP